MSSDWDPEAFFEEMLYKYALAIRTAFLYYNCNQTLVLGSHTTRNWVEIATVQWISVGWLDDRQFDGHVCNACDSFVKSISLVSIQIC